MRHTRPSTLQPFLAAAPPAERHGGRWLAQAVWMLFAFLPMLVFAGAPPAAPDGTVVLRAAEAAHGNGATFPTGTPTQAITLPATGAGAGIDTDGSVWLRLEFDWPDGVPTSTLLAAHLPTSCGWLDLTLNGQAVHRDVADPAISTSVCPRPRLFPLPAAALQPRGNRLDIHLRGQPAAQVTSVRRAAGLSEVWIGPHADLADAQSTAGFWQVTVLRVIDVKLLMLGGFILVLAVANRRGQHLAWFALAALSWAAFIAPAWWTSIPLSGRTLELLLASLPAPAVMFAVQFLLGFADRPLSRRLSMALLLQCGLVPLSLVLVPADRLFPTGMVWAVALSLEMAVALTAHLVICWRSRRSDAWAMLLMLGLTAVVWLVDAAKRPEGMAGAVTAAWLIASPYAWSVLLIAIGLRLLYLFNQALLEAEASRLSLEGQVRKITAEIEHNFAQLSEMRVEQVTEQERKRIAADLHDDLGAKLLTIVHTCDNERIATLGREALDEMRLSVRGLSGRPMRLGDAMADWRAETVQRLGQTNIQVEWENPSEDIDHILPARAFVQTTRILREAVSNIIKHSGASRCEVTCFAGDGEYGLVVEDNGRGIATAFDGGLDRGHGMASMKHRAKQLQGQCLVESGIGMGTVIRLTLPL